MGREHLARCRIVGVSTDVALLPLPVSLSVSPALFEDGREFWRLEGTQWAKISGGCRQRKLWFPLKLMTDRRVLSCRIRSNRT